MAADGLSVAADERVRYRRITVGLVLAGAVWRLLIWAIDKRRRPLLLPFNDSIYFSEQARQLAKGIWFREIFVDQPGAEHGPLTSVLMSVVSWPDSYLQWQRLVTTMCGIATVVVLVRFVRRLAGPLEAAIAAGVAAAYPNLWLSDGLAMSESVSMLCVALVLLVSHRVVIGRVGGSWPWLGLGALLGLAGLARSELLLLAPGIVTAVAWRRRRGRNDSGLKPAASALGAEHLRSVPRRRLVVLLAGTAMTVAPWVAFNATRFERPVLLTTNEGGALLGSYCIDTFVGSNVGGWSVLCVFRDPSYRPGEEPSVRSARQRGMALDFARDNAALLPLVVAARVTRLVDLHGLSTLVEMDVGEERYEWAAWAGVGAFWIIGPLAFIGWRRMGAGLERRLILVPMMVTLMTAVVFYGAHRIRSTAEPPLVVLAVVGLASVVRNRRRDPRDRCDAEQVLP